MVSKRVRGDKGFTLIEVMVALTIISVLTAALVPMVVSSIQRIKLAGQKAQELSEQQGIMERRLSGETITHPDIRIPLKMPHAAEPEYIPGGLIETGSFVSFVAD